MEIEGRRLKLAMEACDPSRLDDQQADKHMTVDILLCDLQRIHKILSGEEYYDYEAQEWVKALVPPDHTPRIGHIGISQRLPHNECIWGDQKD